MVVVSLVVLLVRLIPAMLKSDLVWDGPMNSGHVSLVLLIRVSRLLVLVVNCDVVLKLCVLMATLGVIGTLVVVSSIPAQRPLTYVVDVSML